MPRVKLTAFAIPGVSVLVAFLSYSSQFLFYFIEPGPLDRRQSLVFNTLVACIWICYARTCFTDPGRAPKDWAPAQPLVSKDGAPIPPVRKRWCKKCQALKPPRTHHCKTCGRCIPKMDHHCPWTNNCVSHPTIPHFMRFVFYATAAMVYLEYFLFVRAAVIWRNRALPSYLGPTLPQLIHLIILLILNSLTLFAVGVLFLRGIWVLTVNTTTIESWEIERHHAVVRRARALGGYVNGPGGVRVAVKRQEFPYDIGFWSNWKQMMGTGNVLAWFWPFASTPRDEDGWAFETNGFEDPALGWPPPDPDRIPRFPARDGNTDPFTYGAETASPTDEVDAFRQRQSEDLKRWDTLKQQQAYRRRPFHVRYDPDRQARRDEAEVDDTGDEEESEGAGSADSADDYTDGSSGGEEAWRTSEGERLKDFGVDEDVEFYDEHAEDDEDVPLAELIRRRKRAGVWRDGAE